MGAELLSVDGIVDARARAHTKLPRFCLLGAAANAAVRVLFELLLCAWQQPPRVAASIIAVLSCFYSRALVSVAGRSGRRCREVRARARCSKGRVVCVRVSVRERQCAKTTLSD